MKTRKVRGRIAVSANVDPTSLQVIRAHDGSPVSIGPDGSFSLEIGKSENDPSPEEPLRLLVRRGPGLTSEVAIDPTVSEVVIVAPEPVSDPREVIATVKDRLTAERAARATARTALAAELSARTSDDGAIDAAVDAVLKSVASRTGGDLTWRIDSGFAANPTILTRQTDQAVRSAISTINVSRPIAKAKLGTFNNNGETLPSADLISRVTGSPKKELLRRQALATARLRNAVTDSNGLPVPLPQPNPANAPAGTVAANIGAVPALVTQKVGELIDAMRLPEDPPLLQANSAVTGTGAQVELAGGIADAVAFHDFHELVLAMPNIWTEVFDSRFVETVREAVTELSIAGVNVSNIANAPNGTSPEALLQNLRSLTTAYSETNAVALRSAAPFSRRSTVDGPGRLLGASDGLIAKRAGDDFDALPDRPRPQVFAPVPPVHTPPVDPPLLDPDRGPAGLLEQLEGYLRGRHSFTVFPAHGAQRALNFGLLLTWRQRWEPLSYQTGEIAYTTTLAPGERRKVVTRRVRRLKRYTSEAEKSQQSRRFETNETNRAESEILRKADATTNFQLTSDGSTNLLVENGSFHTSTTRDVSKGGNDSRRRFREAVIKAAQEYRDEHSLEVRTESEESLEEETTSEIHNPNDELAVTAVFYSLQRRYQVSEQLYRARPIIMVAMPVPNPAEITTAWLVRYAWIIARSLLADRFHEALTYLTTSFLGDTEALNALRKAVDDQKAALDAAQGRMRSARASLESRGLRLREIRERLAEGEDPGLLDGIPVLEQVGDALDFVGNLFGGGSDDAAKREREALLLAAAEEEFDRAERQEREAETNLHSATNAYQESVRAYVDAKRVQRNHEVRIAELRVHVSDNILHYMHAIWATQPPDQRFFELHAVQVPDLTTQVTVTPTGNIGSPGVGGFTPAEFVINFTQGNAPLTFRPLAEVAELDQLLGFKGNYALFPMRQGNALTDALLVPYLDAHEILSDPTDPAANWTMDELRAYADHLRSLVTSGVMPLATFNTDHAPFLRVVLEQLITDPRPSESMVIVPTDSLYAELLTSGQSLIEPFKKEHRSLDVGKVRAEIREAELENLRRALRLDSGELSDPDIDDFERHLLKASVTPPGS